MDLLASPQQEAYKKQKLDIEKHSKQDVEEKKRRVNDWLDRNKGYDLDRLKKNIQRMDYDFICLAEALLEVSKILDYLYHIKVDSELIKGYYEKVESLGFDLTKLAGLVYLSKNSFGYKNLINEKIREMIKDDIRNIRTIIMFIADDTKIHQKKSPYEYFEEGTPL